MCHSAMVRARWRDRRFNIQQLISQRLAGRGSMTAKQAGPQDGTRARRSSSTENTRSRWIVIKLVLKAHAHTQENEGVQEHGRVFFFFLAATLLARTVVVVLPPSSFSASVTLSLADVKQEYLGTHNRIALSAMHTPLYRPLPPSKKVN